MATKTTTLSSRDTGILRRLAARVASLAQDPVNLERKRLWYALDEGRSGRPMVLAEVGGILDEVAPAFGALQCEDPQARAIEQGFRVQIWQFDVLRDDHVIEPCFNVNWSVDPGNYGVQSVPHTVDNNGRLASRSWEPPLKNLDGDFAKLRPRAFAVDREATLAAQEKWDTLFGDLLPVRIRGAFWWTLGMTIRAIDLIGLESLMLSMYDNPDGLHRLMRFLCDDHLAFARWLEREGLLNLNNANDYIGSGSMGYTRQLPAAGRQDGAPVRTKDLWALLESQETVGVGPELFEAFIFPYQREIAQAFGRCYYGCCEPVHTRWHVLKQLPHLARVSVSPWADEAFMARELGDRFVYSRKPNPALISTERFDEAAIRADLRRTLDLARGCRVEIIMKDVHTVNNDPSRLPRWVELARREIGA